MQITAANRRAPDADERLGRAWRRNGQTAQGERLSGSVKNGGQ
jgi:hypothetical protein